MREQEALGPPRPSDAGYRSRSRGRRLLGQVRDTVNWWLLAAFAAIGVAAAAAVIYAVLGEPLDYRVAINLLCFVIGVGLTIALGALLAAAVYDRSEQQSAGAGDPGLADPVATAATTHGGTAPFHQRLRAKMNLYTWWGATLAGATGAVIALFWWLAVSYSTIPVWIGIVSAAAGICGFLLGRWATQTRSDRAKRFAATSRNVTDQFAPSAVMFSLVAGVLIAIGLLWQSAAFDTNAAGNAPVPVMLPKGGTYASYRNYVALGDSYTAGEGVNPKGVLPPVRRGVPGGAGQQGRLDRSAGRLLWCSRRRHLQPAAGSARPADHRAARPLHRPGHFDHRR